MKRALLLSLFALAAGCAPAVTPAAKLTEAGERLARLRASPDCAGLVAEAEEAIDYARFEERAAGERRLLAFRADVALLKARRAEIACGGVGER